LRSTIRPGAVILACVLLGCANAAAAAAPGRTAPAVDASGFALLELFTSEGCSSCPPADALLARLVAESRDSGRRVYALSFHVDYWDRLGWKDRFSSAAWSRRQGEYARRFHLGSLYTPQLVVNGAREMVGSDATQVDAALRAALASPTRIPVTVHATARGLGVSVRCKVEQAPAGAVLLLAWVDATASSAPDNGENRGRALHHVNVVRNLHSVALDRGFDGTVELKRPEIRDGAVIAWVQEAGAGAVAGAAAAEVRAR
jgi:hypothetical protein